MATTNTSHPLTSTVSVNSNYTTIGNLSTVFYGNYSFASDITTSLTASLPVDSTPSQTSLKSTSDISSTIDIASSNISDSTTTLAYGAVDISTLETIGIVAFLVALAIVLGASLYYCWTKQQLRDQSPRKKKLNHTQAAPLMPSTSQSLNDPNANNTRSSIKSQGSANNAVLHRAQSTRQPSLQMNNSNNNNPALQTPQITKQLSMPQNNGPQYAPNNNYNSNSQISTGPMIGGAIPFIIPDTQVSMKSQLPPSRPESQAQYASYRPPSQRAAPYPVPQPNDYKGYNTSNPPITAGGYVYNQSSASNLYETPQAARPTSPVGGTILDEAEYVSSSQGYNNFDRNVGAEQEDDEGTKESSTVIESAEMVGMKVSQGQYDETNGDEFAQNFALDDIDRVASDFLQNY